MHPTVSGGDDLLECGRDSGYNIRMNRLFFHLLVAPISAVLVFLFVGMPARSQQVHPGAEATPLQDLHYTDPRFITLYEAAVASKNRLLDGERLEVYPKPKLFSYTLKRGEDIWTLMARTSLNIDTIATLNRVDFIGMIEKDTTVYLPDTLGVFHRVTENTLQESRAALAFRYGVSEKDVLELSDPLAAAPSENRSAGAAPGGEILVFVPEVTLPFLARTYLMGVVFHTPLMGIETSSYGNRIDPFINQDAFHGGVDIAAAQGKKVHAARWGTVLFSGEREGYGNTVIIRHELGYHTLYAHLDTLLVETEEEVISGQVIGTVGETGRASGPHLHFEIRRFDEQLDPGNIPFFL